MIKILNIIKRKWMKLRLQPIRIFCFHQTSSIYDPSTMKMEDWTEISLFKSNILKLKKTFCFISLSQAYALLKNDDHFWRFRFSRYAVLTSDDGWASLMEILPWLDEQRIPITLFVNPGYMDGNHFREKNSERYLSIDEIGNICDKYPLVSIGMHGWEHTDAEKQTSEEFQRSLEKSIKFLSLIPAFIPFWAFAWDRSSTDSFKILDSYGVVPVKLRGNNNYVLGKYIDREPFDNIKLD